MVKNFKWQPGIVLLPEKEFLDGNVGLGLGSGEAVAEPQRPSFEVIRYSSDQVFKNCSNAVA